MRRLVAAATMVVGVVCVFAPSAAGDGGPPISTSVDGVAAPSGKAVYETIPSGRDTIVLSVQRRSDRIVEHRTLPLSGFGIPAIGLYEPTPAGLSADGRILVLQGPGVYGRPPKSSFAIVDTKSLRLRGEVVRLRGAFGFDGLSPNGRRMYLVQYPSPLNDPADYEVRAYNLGAGHLAPKPIVDPSDDEQMRGLPVTRVMSPGGRWAYTLYTGVAHGKAPFIHALDLGKGRAKCIDLPRSVGGVYNDSLRITPGGKVLTLLGRNGDSLASVDTRTFDVATPAVAGAVSSGGSGSTLPWLLLALGAGLLIAAGSVWAMPRLHRRRLAGTED